MDAGEPVHIACGLIDPETDAQCARAAVTFAVVTPEARVPVCPVHLEVLALPVSGDL